MNGYVLDLIVAGPVFLDVSLAGLTSDPRPGREVFTEDAAIGPGGAATASIAAARLGLRTALSSLLGGDRAGEWCRDLLVHEGVDTTATQSVEGWPTPVTVCLSQQGDRALITHQRPATCYPEPLPASHALLANLRELPDGLRGEDTIVFADIGWDASEKWDPADLAPLSECHVFLPNAAEAMAYTHTDTPRAAARELSVLVERVIVTCGAEGVIAIDSGQGTEATVPAIPVRAIDPTGAGDVLAAAVVAGTLRGWTLKEVVAYGALCAGLAVEQLGSSLAAPTEVDVARWWTSTRSDGAIAARYGFLESIV